MKRVALLPLALAVAACDQPTAPAPSPWPDARPSFVAGGNSGPKANGQGSVTFLGELRTFAFNAQIQNDGSIVGHAELHNRGLDIRDHIDIQCLRVIGNNTASMSGIITQSNVPANEGTAAHFAVRDLGEGQSNSADQITLALVLLPAPLAPVLCNALPNLTFMPIENGNIQVHP